MPLLRVIEKLWYFCVSTQNELWRLTLSFAGKEAPAPQKKKRLIDDQVFYIFYVSF